MALGLFVFALQTAPFQERRRSTSWRWPRQARVGARPAAQYLGPGEDEIELSGVLMPELTGGALSLSALRAMAEMRTAWPLIDGQGRIYGFYVIDAVEETASRLMDNGAAQRIEFVLRLSRTDDVSSLIAGVAGAAGAALTGLF